MRRHKVKKKKHRYGVGTCNSVCMCSRNRITVSIKFFVICWLCVGFQPPCWKNEQRYFKNFGSIFGPNIGLFGKSHQSVSHNLKRFQRYDQKTSFGPMDPDRTSKLQFLVGPPKVNSNLGRISHCFRHIASFPLKNAHFPTDRQTDMPCHRADR